MNFTELASLSAYAEYGQGAAQADTVAQCVCVSDEIEAIQDTLLRGHGTQVVDGDLVATVCGTVERVNKLVTVKALHARYTPEIGDVVVGRVVEVSGKRWRIDLQSRQEAHLLLSAVNLPGSTQRRRTAEDELNMRSVLKEGDLLSAEVQAVHGDGTVMLHTRSLKYGRLQDGRLLQVPANLVKRQKRHFQTIGDVGVDIILGCNGLVWLAPSLIEGGGKALAPSINVARVAHAIEILALIAVPVQVESLAAILRLSDGVHPKNMLSPANVRKWDDMILHRSL